MKLKEIKTRLGSIILYLLYFGSGMFPDSHILKTGPPARYYL
jgi:hypothetical protein